MGGVHAIRTRSPIIGGAFAVWGGIFASFDCSLAWYRQKEDPWNSIMSGAATGGVLALRAGPMAAARNAAVGGVLLAMIEGLGLLISRWMAPPPPSSELEREGPEALAPPIAFGSQSITDMLSGMGGGGGGGAADVDKTAENAFDTDHYTQAPRDSFLDDPYANEGAEKADEPPEQGGFFSGIGSFFGGSSTGSDDR